VQSVLGGTTMSHAGSCAMPGAPAAPLPAAAPGAPAAAEIFCTSPEAAPVTPAAPLAIAPGSVPFAVAVAPALTIDTLPGVVLLPLEAAVAPAAVLAPEVAAVVAAPPCVVAVSAA
jgi:hypothetical protein